MPKIKLVIEINGDNRPELVSMLDQIREEIAESMVEVVGMTMYGPHRQIINSWKISEWERKTK